MGCGLSRRGLRVRADILGEARLLRNSAMAERITLSWGSSRLAVDLGLGGSRKPAAVIGAGVMGLTTARLLQEAGIPVTIYAAALPPETTSDVAGGQWHPAWHFRASAVTPGWRRQYSAAADYSWGRFQLLVGADYGIRWLPTYSERTSPEPPLLPTFPPINRCWEQRAPFRGQRRAYDTLSRAGRFLRRLMQDSRSQAAGWRTGIESPAEWRPARTA